MSALIAKRPTYTRKVKVAPGVSGKQNTFRIAAVSNSVKDLRQIAVALIDQGTTEQIALGNDPTRLLVDGRDNRSQLEARRNIEVLFGNTLDIALVDAIEKTLIANIQSSNNLNPRYVNRWHLFGWKGRVGNINNWKWVYVPPKQSKKAGSAIEIDPRQMSSFPVGGLLILKPRDGNTEVGLANRVGAWVTQRRTKAGNQYSKFPRPSTRKGFIAQTTDMVKRKKFARAYTIWGGYTKNNPAAGEQWMPDEFVNVRAKIGLGPGERLTPYIMLLAKSKRTGGRGYQTDASILKRELAKSRQGYGK